MEGYMRIGLLIVTAVILFLIVFEYRSRRRPLRIREEGESNFLIQNEPVFNMMQDTVVEPKQPVRSEIIAAEPAPAARDLLVISVLAKPEQYFVSYDLIQAISASGLQFGDMNIFHYYNADREPLFSLASATEPGDFDIDHIGDFSCAGLTLFMDIRAVINPEQVFELMLTTAQQLADDLDGELCAGQKQPWNNDVLQQYRNRIGKHRLHAYPQI